MKINTLTSKLYQHRLKVGLALLVFILLISSILLAIWWNQQQSLRTPGTDPEIAQPVDNPVSKSADGNHSAQLTGTTDNPILKIDDIEADTGVAYFKWGKDGYLYYVKSINDNTARILRRLPNQPSQTLVQVNGHSAGFDFLNQALIYTTKDRVGVYRFDTLENITAFTFATPVLGADDEFIPNIIPDEDGKAATVTIYDQDYLNNGKVIYLVVNTSGQITNRTESVAF